MLTPHQLHNYQRNAVIHQLSYDDSMLWIGMGLGKTPITLTTIDHRMRAGQVQKTLVIAPLRVCHAVWEREARKWTHLSHLRFAVIHGPAEKRERQLFSDADIYLINYENIAWLSNLLHHYYISQDKPLPFQMLVYDEVSKMKNSQAQRFKGGTRITHKGTPGETKVKLLGWRKMLPHFKYRTGLTGTPASNGYLDLHGQYLAVDGGVRLGEYITHYRDAYFTAGYDGWTYTPTELGKQWIEHKIADITVKMEAEDYLELPPLITNDIMVDLPPGVMKQYKEVEKDMFTRLDDGTEIEVFSKTSVSNKCLQFCIAEGTDVLSDNGWKKIENITAADKVWDGDEWVSVDGLACNGYKEIIDCDGVDMTPDHKVLTVSGWAEARDAVYDNACGRFDRASVWPPYGFEKGGIYEREKQESALASEMRVREGISDDWSESQKSESTRDKVLRVSSRGNHSQCDRISRDDRSPCMGNLAKHEIPVQQPEGQELQKLWCQRYFGLSRVARIFRQILGRHGSDLQGSFDYRENRQQRQLSQRKLSLEGQASSVEQHQGQSSDSNTYRTNHCDPGCETIRSKTGDNLRQDSQRVERGDSDSPRRVKKVYDLINAGRRHRFTVRGSTGKIFIVHNCNGSPYLEPLKPDYYAIHDAKFEALDSIIEEAAGSLVLVSYTFKADAERMMQRYKRMRPVNLTTTPASQLQSVLNDCKAGKVSLLIGHPASMGHGVDGLQDCCHTVVWFGLNWSLELYEQMIARVKRQGQKNTVTMHRILAAGTLDLAVADALMRKDGDQTALKNAIQRYRDGLIPVDGGMSFL